MSVRREKRRHSDGRVRTYWRVDVVYRHPDGRVERVRRVSPVQTKRGAEQYERELRQAIANGTYGRKEEHKKPPRIRDYAEEFIRVYAIPNNKPSEVQNKRMSLKNHILPTFGKMRLDEIRYRDVERFKSDKLREGLKPASVNNNLAVLSRMLTVAREWELIDHAPKVRWLKVRQQPFDFLTFGEADRLLEAADEDAFPLILMGLRTGLRLGELQALKWEDLDFVSRKVVVRRNWSRGQLVTPKNDRIREVPLSRRLVRALKRARHLKGEFVFCQADGQCQTRYLLRVPLWRACRKAGLRKIGWHVARHTFASHLVMRGVPLRVVQELMGHRSLQMTLRYAHLSPAARHDAVELLDRPRPHSGHATDQLDDVPVKILE